MTGHPFDAIADGIDALPAMVPGVCMPAGPQVDQLASWLRWTPCRDAVVESAVPASLAAAPEAAPLSGELADQRERPRCSSCGQPSPCAHVRAVVEEADRRDEASRVESATERENTYPGEDDLVEVVTRALWPDLGDRLTAIRAVRVVLDEQVCRPNPHVALVRDQAAGAYGQGGGELATFARWLIAMDDPDDADGMRARQTVTLTSIIAQARAALTADSAPATDGGAS